MTALLKYETNSLEYECKLSKTMIAPDSKKEKTGCTPEERCTFGKCAKCLLRSIVLVFNHVSCK